jgi:hypothetical protein
LCDGAFGCGAEGDGAGGQSEGFQTFTTGDHSGFSFYHGFGALKGGIRRGRVAVWEIVRFGGGRGRLRGG